MIYFIRHGESKANVVGLFAGQKEDSPLTETGRNQARQAGESVAKLGIKIDRIISSPLTRARETAELVARVIGYGLENIVIDDRISEYDMGELTGAPQRKITSRELTSALGAEDPKDFRLRVRGIIDEYRQSSENILMVSHAGVGRIIACIEARHDPADFYSIDALPNASVTRVA